MEIDGDRNIFRSFPSDEWGGEEFWPGGYSALTNVGKRNLYELGQYLRERYAPLLGNNGEYSANTIYVRATVGKNKYTSKSRIFNEICFFFRDRTLIEL